MRKVEPRPEKPERGEFERTARELLDRAVDDPEAFWDEIKATGRHAGAAVEHVYRELQADSAGVRRAALHRVTARAAQKIKQLIGD